MLDSSLMASLHNHSYYSLLDSTMSPEFIVQQAHDLGYKAVSITEHGSMHSFINGYKKAKELGIKYIFGVETYETDNMDYKEKDSQRYHLLLLAKNKTGLDNIFKIVSESNTRGYYGKPRVDRDLLREYSEGIICTSACLASRLMRLLQQGYCPCCKVGNGEHKENCTETEEFVPKWEEARKELQVYKGIFGDDFYIELQSHGTHDQMIGNQRILKLAQETDTKYIITFDSHMPDGSEKTRDIHRKFIKIAQNSREVGETYKDCYQQDMETMYNILIPQLGEEIVDQAVLYTSELADKCNVEINLKGDPLMPHIEVPKEFDTQLSYLKHLINEGWKNRGINKFPKEKRKQYKERVFNELDVLEYLDYIGYFLILHKITKEFKKNNIPLGYSRGSGAGCLILWIIGVTEIDSIRWDLDFSRFANKGRKSPADYDMDISKKKRGLALKLIDEMFGEENIAHLCTFNSLSPKVAIKDLGKVFDEEKIYKISYKDRDKMSKLIPEKMTIEEALENSSELRRYQERYPILFEYASAIQNFPKSVGCHASAIIISDNPIIQHAPVMLNKDGRTMLQVEMGNAEKDLHLVKFDFLGLISLDTVDDTLKLANLKWSDIDLQYLDSNGKLDDKDVLDSIYAKGNTLGIFQMESQTPQMLFKRMYDGVEKERYNVEDVIAVNAINRPAILSVGMHNNYIKGKKDPSTVNYVHDDVRPIFEKTNSIMLYQEQALQVFRLAGFPEEQVDNARRSIGKKIQEEMDSLYNDFHNGLSKRKWEDNQILEMWKLIEAQAQYSFNRSHSVSYGLLSYVMAYLKHYYPVEFMTALLISEIGNYEQTARYIDECRNMGIKVLPPDVNISNSEYSIKQNGNEKVILFGLSSVKGMSSSVVKKTIEERKIKEFIDIYDYIERVKPDKTSVISLIKSGAFGINNKNKLLTDLFEFEYTPIKWTPVKTCPTKKKLYELKLIKTDEEFKDKATCIERYNEVKYQEYLKKEEERKQKQFNEFSGKYISESEDMYEYETLSIFLNGTPFDNYKDIFKPIEQFPEGSEKILIGGTITDIQRKKDKSGKQYAYIWLLTVHDGMQECIAFASTYSEYKSLIEKGSNVVLLVKPSGTQFIVSKMRTFENWQQAIERKRKLKGKGV